MQNFNEMNKDDVVTNMIGHVIEKEELNQICNRMNLILKSEGSDIKITPSFLISAYHKNRYFLRIMEFLISDNAFEYFLEDIEDYKELINTTLLNEEYILDLRFSQAQYVQTEIINKKRRKVSLTYSQIEKIICSACDLFINSFDQGIDDTYSRDFFYERADEYGLIPDS